MEKSFEANMHTKTLMRQNDSEDTSNVEDEKQKVFINFTGNKLFDKT